MICDLVKEASSRVGKAPRRVNDAAGRMRAYTDEYNNTSIVVHNAVGNVTQTMSQTKNEHGEVVWKVIRTIFDNRGKVTYCTDEFLDVTGNAVSSGPVFASRTVYDDQGRSVGTQRLEGAIVDIDPVSGETTLIDAGTVQHETASIYDDEGRLYQSVSSTGTINTYEYDSLDRQVATIGHALPLSQVGTSAGQAVPDTATTVSLRSETIYNDDGQVAIQRTNIRQFDTGDIDDSDAQETSYTYDHKDQIIRTTFDDGTFIEAEYDEFGRVIAETNQLGQTRTTQYNDRGQMTSVTLPEIADPLNGGQLTSPSYEYSYDAQGNMVQLTDPLGRDTRFTFDSRGRQLSRTLPLGFGLDGMFGTVDDATADLGFTEHMEYDTKGRMTLQTSFEGVVTEYIYDDAEHGTGRVKENGTTRRTTTTTTVWSKNHRP